MSRDIPLDRPLTDDDRRYLRQRGAFGEALEKRVDTEFPPDEKALAAFEARERADSITAPGDLELREENARLREELARLQSGAPVPAEEADADLPPYEQWTLAELQAEVKARNETKQGAGEPLLATSGTKADLAARLAADDGE